MDIEKRIEDCDFEIIKGQVYNVFECCIRTVDLVIKAKNKIRVCQDHGGVLITKFKICKSCKKTVIGPYARRGETCADCRKYNKSDIWEHKRGMYCRHYVVEEHGCFLCDDCWYCGGLSPIFKGTGPKQKTRRL